ncbi:hypothetical protein H7I53_04935 [Mycolicibacterium pulveris]|uniref:ESX-1 secretion-associated protein EspB n=1 Tax=Mycolicibacterium pulveris TaxID=36813 RepID=A0A7I7UJD6_MYCPV|nr:hypothetical protein [Mycolicibacterium pulveris]MCV6979571.1 hypothetical protein [Mycolicibacterium pulveris]BBY80983.1 hypothetical protein MPUL_21410 [Mycolicibacterium pulveris]
MSAEVRVDPASLRAQAATMRRLTWSIPTVHPVPPDALPLAKDAVDNLNEIARVLTGYQNWAEAENRHIAEMLDDAAAAYARVDDTFGDRLDDPGRRAAIEEIALPTASTPLPALPDGPTTPRQLSAGEYSDVKKTHGDLNAGDHGASLQMAEVQWGLASAFVESHAAPREVTNWEGAAADTAHARMTAFSAWLHDLSAAWQRLAQAAAKVGASHRNATNQHIPIFTRYVALEAQLAQAAAGADVDAIVDELGELQRLSDEVREEYARNATVDPVRLEDPPGAGRGGGSAGAGGAQPGGAATGGPDATAEHSLAGPTPAAAGQPGRGVPASGATPSGGGSPSDGGAAGGAPDSAPGATPTVASKPLADPSLRPAATAGGGSGGAGAGGGAGGGKGVGAQSLSPAVTAETVAPAPVPVTSAAAGAAPGPSATGPMAGGMGMAPMHGGVGAGQGREKRRNPDLAPDEELYTEDRPWTEAVIGNRRRRGDGGENKERQ